MKGVDKQAETPDSNHDGKFVVGADVVSGWGGFELSRLGFWGKLCDGCWSWTERQCGGWFVDIQVLSVSVESCGKKCKDGTWSNTSAICFSTRCAKFAQFFAKTSVLFQQCYESSRQRVVASNDRCGCLSKERLPRALIWFAQGSVVYDRKDRLLKLLPWNASPYRFHSQRKEDAHINGWKHSQQPSSSGWMWLAMVTKWQSSLRGWWCCYDFLWCRPAITICENHECQKVGRERDSKCPGSQYR